MASTVLFDLDGTLYDRDLLVRALAENQYDEFRGDLCHIDSARYVERLIELDDHGYRPKYKVYESLAQEFVLRPALQQNLEDHFWSTYDSFCVLPEDVTSTLNTLSANGKTLGIITNGSSERQQAKIDALGIRSWFNAIVVSEEVGLRKPDPAIFHKALSMSRSAPEDAIFVGDNPTADIEGAIGAGLRAVWKAVPYWHLARNDVPRIDRLSELLPLVARKP